LKSPTLVIATIRRWNQELAEKFKVGHPDWEIHLILKKEDLRLPVLERIHPDYIFFPHWSWIIPEEVYAKWECVVFHMTDLPFGRGGSPLQNLLARGIHETKITALRVTGGIDEGPIYLKRDLDLSSGSAEEIYRKASKIIFEDMIPFIVENRPSPVPQEGEGVYFERRRPEESEIEEGMELSRLYDHIRMLDAEGYPRAFLRCKGFRFEFSDARLKKEREEIEAFVRICVERGHEP